MFMRLELYEMTYCPFCQRVRKYIQKSKRTDIEFKDIQKDKEAYQRLIQVGKIDQVPCLFIDGKPLYESMDIIAWLENHPQE